MPLTCRAISQPACGPGMERESKGRAIVTRTFEFSLFVLGADLTVACTVERLERAGYTHPVAAASAGIQSLAFSRQAAHFVEAVDAAVSESECIAGVCIGRDVRSNAVAVFHPVTMEPMDLAPEVLPTEMHHSAPAPFVRSTGQSQHLVRPSR